MKIELFKIHASAVHIIMTNPQKKSETLSETTKNYCELWVKEQLYNRKKQIFTDAMTKGNECEQESIDTFNLINNCDVQKNTQTFENDYKKGTPDIILNRIFDVKNSYDFDTFPLFETENPKNYIAQLQTYMDLTGSKEAQLIYTLNNMPDRLLTKYANRLMYQKNISFEDAYAEVELYYNYDLLDINLKYREMPIIYFDADFNKAVDERVLLCRDYINYLLKKL